MQPHLKEFIGCSSETEHADVSTKGGVKCGLGQFKETWIYRYMSIFTLLVICLSSISATPLKVHVDAKAALVMNAKTGAILYEKKGDEMQYPASLTKIATLLYALEKKKGNLDEVISCPSYCLKRIHSNVKVAHDYQDPAYWLEPDGTHFWIRRGEKLSFRNLLYGLMLASGNDAANCIAHHVGGRVDSFVEGMNNYLKQIGCRQTHFCNPHGLHHPKHVSTAHDIALIVKQALQNSLIRTIVASKQHERAKTNMQEKKLFFQHNLLLKEGKFFYSHAIGVKTGYTSKAGYNLAAAATQGERALIAVVLGCKDSKERYRDTIRLFEKAFSELEETRLLFGKDENLFIREVDQARGVLSAALIDDVKIHYFPSEEPEVRIEMHWEAIDLPIQAGTWVGEMHVYDQNQILLEKAPLYAKENVEKKRYLKFLEYLNLGSYWKKQLIGIVAFFILGGLLFYFVDSRR